MSKRLLTAAAACALAGALMIGGTFAYLSDKDEKNNTFTVGNIDISLLETFDETSAQNIVPNQEIAKVPTVKNEGANDAFVFLEVTVPRKEVVTVDATTGKRAAAATVQDLFTLLNSDDVDITTTGYGNDGKGWALLNTASSDTENIYVFGYKQKLAAGTTTAPLMSKVRLINLVEGQFGSDNSQNELTIPIKAFAIQSSDITGIDTTDMSATNLLNIYNICVQQSETTTDSSTTDSSTTTSET